MLVGESVGIGRCDERGNVSACFGRQIGVDVPKIFGLVSGTFNRLVHIARSAVVGCKCERPVFVDSVQVFQIAAGRFGREYRVAPLVYE